MNFLIDSLTKRYGAHVALDGLCLDIPSKIGCLVLIGPSGGGKSTLLRLLGGLEAPDAGRIVLDGETLPTDAQGLLARRRRNGFLFQNYSLFPHLTALRNVTLPLEEVSKMPAAEARNLAMESLERFGLAEHAAKFPSQLSGGQQQRVALVRAMVHQPRFLFLDEPTAALDPEMTVEVLECVRRLIAGGQEVVLCTHEMAFAHAVADHVAFVAEGKILAHGAAADFFAERIPMPPPLVARLRKFLGSHWVE